jgi:hypothetical protein
LITKETLVKDGELFTLIRWEIKPMTRKDKETVNSVSLP